MRWKGCEFRFQVIFEKYSFTIRWIKLQNKRSVVTKNAYRVSDFQLGRRFQIF